MAKHIEAYLNSKSIIEVKQLAASATIDEIKESLDALSALSFHSGNGLYLSCWDMIRLRFDILKALAEKLNEDEIKSLPDATMHNLFKLSLIACDAREDNDSGFAFLEKLYGRYKDKIDNKFKDLLIVYIYSITVELDNLLDHGLLYSHNITCNLAKLSGTKMLKFNHTDFVAKRKFTPEKCTEIVSEDVNKKLLIILDDHGSGDVHRTLGQPTTVWVNSFLKAINDTSRTNQAEILIESCCATNAIKNLKDTGYTKANAKVAALSDKPIFFFDLIDTILGVLLNPKVTSFSLENIIDVYGNHVKAHIESNPGLASDHPESRSAAYNPALIDCATGEYFTEMTIGSTLTSQESKAEITDIDLLGANNDGGDIAESM